MLADLLIEIREELVVSSGPFIKLWGRCLRVNLLISYNSKEVNYGTYVSTLLCQSALLIQKASSHLNGQNSVSSCDSLVTPVWIKQFSSRFSLHN